VQHEFEQPTEQIAPPESAADVRRMLAEAALSCSILLQGYRGIHVRSS
jgi:hypothetical protein